MESREYICFGGIGFPSSSQELRRFYYPWNDPNGYYDLFGLNPQASFQEIREVYREMVKECHPDGTDPDVETFRTITDVYHVLMDPVERVRYGETPSGKHYIGESEKRVIVSSGASLSPEKTKKTTEGTRGYTYYSWCKQDPVLVEEWYHYLLESAYWFRHVDIIRLGIASLGQAGTKTTGSGGFVIYWVDDSVEPNWATAFSVVSLGQTLYSA